MKKILLIGIAIMALLLTGCTQIGGLNQFTNHRLGTQGVEINFIENMPADVVYFERNRMGVQNTLTNLGVMVSNKGATDSDDIYLVIHGYDPNILNINSRDIRGYGSFGTNLIERIYLQGKTTFNPIGEYESFFFDISLNGKIPGSFNEFETPFIATVCYDYQTIYEQDICIDPEINPQQTSGEKACTFKDTETFVPTMPWNYNPQQTSDSASISSLLGIGTTSKNTINFNTGVGQGGPVAVTKIETRRILTNTGVKFTYLITIANLGSGEVVSKERCFNDIQPLTNAISIKTIVGVKELTCNFDSFELINGEEKTIACYYETDSGKAYETTMNIQLDYDYSTSILRTTTLKRE